MTQPLETKIPCQDTEDSREIVIGDGVANSKKIAYIKPNQDAEIVTTQPTSLVANSHDEKNADHLKNQMIEKPLCLNNSNENSGLQNLQQFNQFIIKQDIELLEACLGCETANSYQVMNGTGQTVFEAKEKSCCCFRQWCGSIRGFTMEIRDLFGNVAFIIKRPLRCRCCCICNYPCCPQVVTVETPDGTEIGRVEEQCTIWRSNFHIQDKNDDTVLKIRGPCCKFRCCKDVVFTLEKADGTGDVGQISKKWGGIIKEALTDADTFTCTFPIGYDVEVKATILAAVFLIDFMFFEDNDKNKDGTATAAAGLLGCCR